MSSKYRDRDGHPKTPYKYPAWVTEGRAPPPQIQEELALRREIVRREGAMQKTHTYPARGNC